MTYLTGEYTVTGAGGQSLEDKWKAKFATLHGVLTHGFPNMVLVGHMRDGGGSTNANFPFTHQAVYAAALIKKVMARGASSFDVTQEAEDRWQIGRASCGAGGCQYVYSYVDPGTVKNKKRR